MKLTPFPKLGRRAVMSLCFQSLDADVEPGEHARTIYCVIERRFSQQPAWKKRLFTPRFLPTQRLMRVIGDSVPIRATQDFDDKLVEREFMVVGLRIRVAHTRSTNVGLTSG